MATDVNQAYFSWSQEELSERDGSQAISASQMLNHGSISFGRFQFESLSWEKWSVFTHDRRQEELEKFNGLVAEKKAYFEEYYRKMRALKSLQQQQQSQQTELSLDYSCDGSVSSQAGDEDGSQHESLRDQTVNMVDSTTQEKAVAEIKSRDSQHNMKTEFSSTNQSSSRGSLDETELERSLDNVLSMQPLVTESTILYESQKEIGEFNCKKLVNKQIDKVHLSTESDLELGTVTHKTGQGPTNPSDGSSKHGLGGKLVQDKVKPPCKKTLDGHAATKVSVTSIQSGLCSKPKTKPNTANSSLQAKCPLQKTVRKAESNVHTTKELSRHTSTNRSTPTASYRPRTELHSKVSRAPHPPSTTRERGPGIGRTAATNDLKTSNRVGAPLTHARGGPAMQLTLRGPDTGRTAATNVLKASNRVGALLTHARDGPAMQGTNKNMTARCAVKSSRMETKRDSKEASTEPKVLDNRSTRIHLLSTRPWSINLPPSKKSSSTGRSQLLSFMETFKLNKNKEANKEMMQSEGATPNSAAPSYNRNLKTGTEKVVSEPHTRINKPRVSSSSLIGRKTKYDYLH